MKSSVLLSIFSLIALAQPALAGDCKGTETPVREVMSIYFREEFPTNCKPAPQKAAEAKPVEAKPVVAEAPKAAPVETPVVAAAEPKVLFDFNSAILSKEAKAELAEVAQKAHHKNVKVHVAGYTDEVGSDSFNMLLGERRAEAVKAFLVSKGLTAKQIRVESKGKKDPVSESDSAQNRRAELKLIE